MPDPALVRAQESDAIVKSFGYSDLAGAWLKLQVSDDDAIRFDVPAQSLKQAALSEFVIERLFRKTCGRSSGRAILWPKDWSIFYEYELRLFWKNLSHELKPGESPMYSAAYWSSIDSQTLDKLKAAYFMMMAFEFSGCILMEEPQSALLVDDGTATVLGGNAGLRKELLRFAQ